MIITQRDFEKFPLTKAELRKMSTAGRRWSQARIRELVKMSKMKCAPLKNGPRY